jgi:hypothetical protein
MVCVRCSVVCVKKRERQIRKSRHYDVPITLSGIVCLLGSFVLIPIADKASNQQPANSKNMYLVGLCLPIADISKPARA